MRLSLVKPNILALPSYIEALREGKFRPMQLSFGHASPEGIEKAPEKFIAQITSTDPFCLEIDGTKRYVEKHEVLWLVNEDRFMGSFALRYKGDEEIIEKLSGHVGFAIRPNLTGHSIARHSARYIWQEILKRFLAHELSEIIVTCLESNRVSRRLIEGFGGHMIAENMTSVTGEPLCIFRVRIMDVAQSRIFRSLPNSPAPC